MFGVACIFLSVAFAFGVCIFALTATASESIRLTVVIDAGHGGVDGGVVGIESGTKERSEEHTSELQSQR